MQPYVEKHGNNFSAAIRDMINSIEGYQFPIDSCMMDSSLFNWLLEEMNGRLIPNHVINQIIDSRLINNISELERRINDRFNEFKWDIKIGIEHDDIKPLSNITIKIEGEYSKARLVACLLSQFFINNSLPDALLKVVSITGVECIKVELSRSIDKKESIESLNIFFGETEGIVKAIKSKSLFWKHIVDRHVSSNYNMVTIHRNYFEDMLSDEIPMGEITIENLAKKQIRDIPLEEMLYLIKCVYETSRVADSVEIDGDTILIRHSFRNEKVIEKLKKSLITLLEFNGHLYQAQSTATMIVLKHRPDIGTKIDDIINSLKTSDNGIDHELIMFMSFLKELKDIPDVSTSVTALGKRIGTNLMEEYEKNNKLDTWNLETFKKAFEFIDNKICRDSEWVIKKNSLVYTVKKCDIVMNNDSFDNHICDVMKNVFKGAMDYAFEGRTILDIKKLLSHGDDVCEVVIKIK